MTRNRSSPPAAAARAAAAGAAAAGAAAATLLMAALLSAVPSGCAAADEPAATGDASDGAKVFAAHCAVCHGPQAAGIPGSFPPLREQIVAFGKSPEGREYLVMVVTTGLMGELKVGGITYRGVMPAQSVLSEAEVAAVVGFLAGDRGKDPAAATLGAADVAAIRGRHPDRTGQATRALRPAVEP